MSLQDDKELGDTVKRKPSRKKAPKAVPVEVVPTPGRSYRFDQWAARRSILQHHRGGMRAFVSHVDTPRTLEEWDECFASY